MDKKSISQYFPEEARLARVDKALLQILNQGNLIVSSAAKELEQDEWVLLERLNEMCAGGMPLVRLAEGEYVLSTRVDPLSASQLAGLLRSEAQAVPLHVAWSLKSTNEAAAELASRFEGGGFILLAEQQTKGRGRRGKDWLSPFGENLYLSYKVDFSKGAAQLAGLSLVVGVAVASALEELCGLPGISIKWPNDIYYQERKLGGVLIEVVGDMQGNCSAIIGLGINGTIPNENVGQAVAAIEEMLSDNISRHEWVAHIIDAVYIHVERFKKEGLQAFLNQWRRYHLLEGKLVTVMLGENSVEGRAVGITASGELIVETDSGKQTFSAGEVSVRKHAVID